LVTEGFAIDPAEVEGRVLELAQFGACEETGVCRTVYSPAWVAAQERLASWGREAGLAVRQDAVGNLWTRLDGAEPGPVIATGSHLDSQVPGGRYDGVLGAISGVLALRALKEHFGTPRRTLEALAFCEEEGSRFPATNWWGSRAITGSIGPDEPEEITSASGETIGAAMREVGLDPAHIPEAKRDDIDTFIELHIEQGPILEREGFPVGVVKGIPGIRHYLVELVGRTDHAGGVPMDLRRDAMAAAAEIIHRGGETARAWGRPAVTTTGRVHVEPNLAAAIPGKVTFTIDARHPDPDKVQELWAGHEALIEEVARKYDVAASWTLLVDHAPGPSDPGIIALLEATAAEEGIAALSMYSGGGHDTQQMRQLAKTAMIFVQSKDGRSHTPDEYTAPEHMAAGLQLLTAALYRLAY
jgi:allantoate deiminase